MDDQWQAGDLALCIKLGRWRRVGSRRFASSRGVRGGGVYTVRRVGFCPSTGHPTLWLDGLPGERGMDGFSQSRFRKIYPHTPDAEDRETIRLLNGVPCDA